MRASRVAILLLLVACRTTMVSDRLFFGQNIPTGGTVSQAESQTFVGEVITPRFPKGLTIYEANGQWLDPRATLVHERVYVVELLRSGAADENAIAEIASEYKKRFRQDAVLRVTERAVVRFY